MTPTMDEPRRRTARHRAEQAVPLTTDPIASQVAAPSARGAHVRAADDAAAPAAAAPDSNKPRGRRARSTERPAAPKTESLNAAVVPATSPTADPATTAAIPTVTGAADAAPAAAIPTATAPSDTAAFRSARRRTVIAADTRDTASPVARPGAYNSNPQAIVKKAASVRVMSNRMAVAAGAVALLVAVGSAGQAADLPFFGKESSAQDAQARGGITTSGDAAGGIWSGFGISPQPSATTPGLSGEGTKQAGDAAPPAAGDVPAGISATTDTASGLASIARGRPGGLPSRAGEPTIGSGHAAAAEALSTTSPASPSAASSGTASPDPASSGTASPDPASSGTASSATASPTSPAPSEASSPTASTSPGEAGGSSSEAASPSPTPSPTPTQEEISEGQSYARKRLPSYGWGEDQMDALRALWDRPSDWRKERIDAGLDYIKKRYGSPAKALQHRKANKSY